MVCMQCLSVQGVKLVQQLRKCLATVTGRVLLFGAQFGGRTPEFWQKEIRVITETVLAARRVEHEPMPHAFTDERLRVVLAAYQGKYGNVAPCPVLVPLQA